jgi:uncharacterized protein (DUF362 family)
MSEKIKNYNRREFIDTTIKGTVGLLTCPIILTNLKDSHAETLTKSTIVVVKDETVLSSNRINQHAVQVMVDATIKRLTGIQDVGEAWKSLFSGIKKSSIISIKVNCINRSLSSHPEVAYSIVNGLTRMQVEGNSFPENNIIIWDRTNGELRNAGYSINTSSTGVRCFGTSQSGVGYSSTQFNVAGSSQRISRILTDMSDYMINLSVLKNHGTSGVTLSMKNHYGTCNEPGNLHGGYGDPYIPALNNLAPIRNKQVITICDAIYGIISGGPSGNPQVTPKSIIMSKDPVAHDYIAAQMLKDNGCNTLNRATHIATAAKAPYSLGTNDPNQIDLIKIENPTAGIDRIPNEEQIPDDFQLFQNYPNPFNSQTTLSYQLFKPARIRLDIYNMQGELVQCLVDTHQNSGYYRIPWDGRAANDNPVPSGTYLGQFRIDNVRQTIKMQLLK